ncbi:PucR family transcriptional regulator ligand-binding domain-containing protein [Clostridium sp. cel8]|jgi:PucR family transcriptional regulator, purine catabolism regulatory protein|uniref:PucR family transcriptional regulator n=1 Tax=Clostridium sp. cel8 TaxID=2663123 RepID=UPI0015F4C4F4|nr:PucR family transcriptional regulator ligand-binding domain-containing protein [Clostridium sp. cel8]MBA5850351.1 PucR family transcriptional regulator ligand-binding domain-containing protein [Clostridium sp. cel8]
MFITCRNMLNLPGLEKMKVVAGAGGLDKVISWVHVTEIPNAVNYVRGGELLFITGVVIGNNTSLMLKFIKEINLKKLSGLVINVGPYIKSTPKEIIDFANKVDFPVFELPFEVRLIDVTQIICKSILIKNSQKESVNNFMKEIIFEDIDITDEILNRAILYGYSINRYYCAIVVDIDDFSSYIKNNELYNEDVILDIKNYIQAIIDEIMHKNNKKYFCAVQSDSFFIMISLGKNNKKMNDSVKKEIFNIANDIKMEINKRLSPITVSIGIGGICSDLKDFKSAISQGKKTLEILKRLNRNNVIVSYSDLGVFRLFFEMDRYDEMKNLFNENLLKLKEYDKKNSSCLIKTLHVYLKNNRNLGKASEELYIHRNTMKYRVKRIEDILQCDLKDEEVVFNIKLCMQIGIFLNLIKI